MVPLDFHESETRIACALGPGFGQEDVEVLTLDRDAFDDLLRSTPGAGDDIGAVMTARLAGLA